MDHANPQVETLVWADARCADLVGQVLGRMKQAHVLAVGGPRKAQVAELAGSHDAPLEDDLRKMLIERPAAYLLLATAAGVAPGDLAQARAAATVVLAIEPPAFAAEVSPTHSGGPPALIATPWLRMSRTWLSAADPQQALGELRSMQMTAVGPPGAGSLLARLYDALEAVIHLLGPPETIDASLTGAAGSSATAAEDLRTLSGSLTAHLRFANDRAAVLHVADRAAMWRRHMLVIGSDGVLDWSDAAYRLTGPTGAEVDQTPPAHDQTDPIDLIVRQWQRLIDGSVAPASVDARTILACCQAAALSCRTGQLESPGTFLRMTA